MRALVDPEVLAAIEAAARRHLSSPFRCVRVTDLQLRSSHPAALLHAEAGTIFAKLLTGPDARNQARAELSGLELIRERAGVATPEPIGSGAVDLGSATVVMFEGLPERTPEQRTVSDWESIGRTLATLHLAHGEDFGLPDDGYFGPLAQDNRPTAGGSWVDFYRERRVLPWLRLAVDRAVVTLDQAQRVEQLLSRLTDLAGPEPERTLLHGDAQHHNFVSTPAGAVVIDASPYYGHPELDLALVDYFTPVPAQLFAAYAEVHPIDAGFVQRRELWRIFAYLAVLIVDGGNPWGRTFCDRLAAATRRYG